MMKKDFVCDLLAIVGAVWLIMLCLTGCSTTTIDVPDAYLETCYSSHCKAGNRACDCLAESRACQNKLNTQIDKIKGLK